MRTKNTVNPLMLLIMTQAWCHVKRQAAGGGSPSAPSDDDGEEDTLAARCSLVGGENKVFQPASWNYVWSHPFFKSTAHHGALSVRQLARGWGDQAAGFPRVTSMQDWSHLAADPQRLASLRALLVDWDPSWSASLPQWVLDMLALRTSPTSPQVWMSVPFQEKLTEEQCRQAIQLGWSWWLSPPETVSEFPAYLENNFHLWRFWFTNPHSDQWVWPWADIIIKNLCEKYSGQAQDRYWIMDQRQRNAWNKIDDEAWVRIEKIMGGAGTLEMLIGSTFQQLSQVDFLDRNCGP